jgi:hypothetical protein
MTLDEICQIFTTSGERLAYNTSACQQGRAHPGFVMGAADIAALNTPNIAAVDIIKGYCSAKQH